MKRVFVLAVVLLLLVGGLAAAGVYYQLDYRAPGQAFDSNGVRLHYAIEGEGPPVILVHGFAVNGDLNWRWPGIVKKLAARYKVITIDNRGHGLSGKPHETGRYGLEMVEDIVRLMDHLQIEKAHVVGYSMGGYITLKLLATHPDRLLSAAPCASGWAAPEERRNVLNSLAESLQDRRGFAPLTRTIEPGGKPGRFKVWMMDRVLGHINDQEALALVIRQFPEFRVEEAALRDNKVPLLSVVGSEDPLKAGVDRMVGVAARHEVVVLEGKDHISTMRAPAFAEALLSFLDKHNAAA